MELFGRITANSNVNGEKLSNRGRILGYKWKPITVKEKINLFGIMLKIGIFDLNYGGYSAYRQKEICVSGDNKYKIKIDGHVPWARRVMREYRFRQIRSVFCPESGRSGVGNKCYQLCFIINKINSKAQIDEGGHATRSCFCPCRQYNKDKPNKFRVDFIILCDARAYFICHIDVYQGKNRANVGIAPEVQHMLTTQKALANAIICGKISNDPMGYRKLSTDNRCSSIKLAIFLREKCKVLTAGTILKTGKVPFQIDHFITTGIFYVLGNNKYNKILFCFAFICHM